MASPHVYLSASFLSSLSLSSISSYLFHNIEASMSKIETDGLSVTYSSDRTGPPDLRLIHYNDVYHVEYALLSIPFSPSFIDFNLG